MINEQTVKDIQGAIDAIRKRGWTQGKYQDDKGRVCLIGAIRTAVYGVPYVVYRKGEFVRYSDVKSLVAQVVDRSFNDDSLVRFNDDRKTTKRKVLKALKEARIEATKGT